MKEVKSPKKPLIYYYVIVLLVLAAFNFFVSPLLLSRQVTEVDYGTFMSMTEKKNIGRVEVEDSQIIFTDKNNDNIYKTGVMDDPNLTERLYQSGATFSKDIEQTMSPIMSFLLTFILPMVIFVVLGQYLGRKLLEQAGGKNSMAFGMGKSNARVYVQSTEGIHFDDVAGEDEAKENLAEIVDYLQKVLNKEAFDHAGLIYGMGHAVYTLSDPREVILKRFAQALAEEKGMTEEFDLYDKVEGIAGKLIMEHRKLFKNVCANVDFYSGFVYSMLGIPEELFTPIFAIARMPGWSAHRLEELINANKIIRPAYKYVGHHTDFVAFDER